jgi:hypothetical protein
LAALATGAKSYRDNPVIGSVALNRLGLHVTRVRLAHAMAERRRRKLQPLVDADDVAAFARDGFILKRNFLAPEEFAALKQEVFRFKAPARHLTQGDAVTRRIALDAPALARLPAVRAFVRSRGWRDLVSYVGSFTSEPQLYIQTIFSHARAADPDPQTQLHADTFHPTVKAWLFLTDVAHDDGPLVYGPGSHRPTARRLVWERRMSIRASQHTDFLSERGSPRVDRTELRALGLSEPQALAVPENTLVVADTFGFHA